MAELSHHSEMRLFALSATTDLDKATAQALGRPLAVHEEREFEDGEHKARPLDTVRGADVYVMQSLHGGPRQSVNDKLCRLLFFIATLKDCGAARVAAVVPYLCYARKDRRTKPNDPVTTRYIGSLLEAVGTDTVITLEVHNPVAFENGFRCQAVALTSTDLAGDALDQVNAPALFVIGGNDFGVIELNQEAFARIRERKAIEIIPGASHIFSEPGAIEQVTDHAARWFARYLTPMAPGAASKTGQRHAVQR